jgi:hypothetical protein
LPGVTGRQGLAADTPLVAEARQYRRPIVGVTAQGDGALMKRLIRAALWFYVGWYAVAMLAAYVGASDAFGPIAGGLSATIVLVASGHMPRFHRNSSSAT